MPRKLGTCDRLAVAFVPTPSETWPVCSPRTRRGCLAYFLAKILWESPSFLAVVMANSCFKQVSCRQTSMSPYTLQVTKSTGRPQIPEGVQIIQMRQPVCHKSVISLAYDIFNKFGSNIEEIIKFLSHVVTYSQTWMITYPTLQMN